MIETQADGPATAALFDVDGTLVDTNYLHAVTWWEAFAQAGHVVPMADIHRAIGMGSDLMLGKLLPPDRDEDADADIRTAHTALYATYRSRLRPLPGAADLLRACRRPSRAGGIHRGHGLGCAGLPAGRGSVHRPAERRHQR